MILRNYKQYFRNYRKYLVLVFLLFFSCSNTGVGKSYNVLEVYDGDTITIEHPKVKRLRYLGIDAPEKFTNYSPGEPFHLKSTDLNKELVGGKLITIEFDREKYDHYGRLLGYVFADGIFVNEEIVRRGLARTLFIGKNRKYEDRILKAQQEAKRERRGIWSDPGSFKILRNNKRFLIKPTNVRDYINKGVVVRGKVTDLIKKKGGLTVMRMERSLNLVFFKNDLGNFRFFGIEPSKFYLERYVEVIGRIKMYRGSPQITVEHPISIKVLD